MIEMISGLLETMTWFAVAGAFLWGLASILLSPCHLVSVPLLVGFLGRIEGQTLGNKGIAAWVTVGGAISLILVAMISLAVGRILGDLWGIGPWLMIAFLIVAGLVLLEAIEVPSLGRLQPERAKGGVKGAVGAGGILGVTLGPCSFAFFAPLFAFGAGPASWPLKVATLGAFVVAHLLATLAAGMLGARVGGWISRGSRIARFSKGLVGVAAIGFAVDMIINTP